MRVVPQAQRSATYETICFIFFLPILLYGQAQQEQQHRQREGRKEAN